MRLWHADRREPPLQMSQSMRHGVTQCDHNDSPRALIQFGTGHELVIYPRENHLFTERAHQINVLERTRSWFTRWLGDPADG